MLFGCGHDRVAGARALRQTNSGPGCDDFFGRRPFDLSHGHRLWLFAQGRPEPFDKLTVLSEIEARPKGRVVSSVELVEGRCVVAAVITGNHAK